MDAGTSEGVQGWLYDPGADAWSPTGSLPVGPFWGNAFYRPVVLADGRVLIAGGFSADSGLTPDTFANGGVIPTRHTFIYDPSLGSWSQSGEMNVGREEQSSALLPDGRVFTSGGHDRFTPISHLDFSMTATAEIFEVTPGTIRRRQS